MLFELLPYPMDIVITFLEPSKFYIASKNQRPVTSTSGKVGGGRLRRFMVNHVHYRSAIFFYKNMSWFPGPARARSSCEDPARARPAKQFNM